MSLSILGFTTSNVGQILGDANKGVIRNIVIFGGTLSAADMADPATLQAKLVANSKLAKSSTEKVYWLPEVQNFEDKAEQNTTGALNLGPTVMLKEGKAGYEIRVDGTMEFAKLLRKWNNKTIGVLEYDSNRMLWGRQVGTDFKAYTAKMYVNQIRPASGQAPEEGIVTATLSFLSATEYGDQGKCLDLSTVDTALIATQNDAPFRYSSNSTNTFKLDWGIPLGVANSYYDVIAKFSSQITTGGASLFEAFTGTNFGTTLAITSVGLVNGQLSVVFDSAAYTALSAGAKIKFSSKAPSVLDTAGITDIEGNYVILTK